MFYTYDFFGMDIIWWFVWMVLMFWIFVMPYDLPGKRRRKEVPLAILQKCFAAGEISNEEYQECKKKIEAGLIQ